jgi:hypothetical protein
MASRREHFQKGALSMCTLSSVHPARQRGTIVLILALLIPSFLSARQALTGPDESLRNAVDFCPLSPMFRIYAIQYSYRFAPNSEMIVGPYYANIHYKDIGNTNAPGFIIGYRHYFWKSLHVEYQVIPQWDHFYEKNEDKTYPLGFDLWNELRLGYGWDFEVGSLAMYLNLQWPFGFALYSDRSAKPESFKAHVKKEPFFYFPPMIFLGVRF